MPMEEGALLKTLPQPSAENLGRYYQSEDYISHTDGNRNLFEKTYQLIKRFALQRKISLINSYSPGRNLLDIGCGTGDFLAAARRSGWKASGTEPGEFARALALGKDLDVRTDSNVFPPASFDVITLWHVLEHVPDPDRQIREILRLLKPDGIAVIAVPNFRSADARHYGSNWAAYDVPRHLWHFSKTAILNLATRHSMTVTRILPMWFDAFYVCLLSEKNRTGKMNVVKGLWQGLKSNVAALRTGECSSQIYVLRRK